VNLRNIAEFDSVASPAGLHEVPIVKFDVTRTAAIKTWQAQVGVNGGALTPHSKMTFSFPPFWEQANDDIGVIDEDNHPNNGHIYSMDATGNRIGISVANYNAGKYNDNVDIGGAVNTRFIQHMNAVEFVRVKVDGGQPGGGKFTHTVNDATLRLTPEGIAKIPVQGSRATEFITWHSWIDFEWANNTWNRKADVPGQQARNALGLGHLNIDLPGA
jgi:hypothetical protein